jgi:hypothetical protein
MNRKPNYDRSKVIFSIIDRWSDERGSYVAFTVWSGQTVAVDEHGNPAINTLDADSFEHLASVKDVEVFDVERPCPGPCAHADCAIAREMESA